MLMALFGILSVLAIVTGGLLAAFSARQPTTLKVWMSAYLVLVAGIMQLGLALGWQRLTIPNVSVATLALVIYNLGNAGVILGTAFKGRLRQSAILVNTGGIALSLSMVLLLWTVRSAKFSWTLTGFLLLTTIILVSMPIGLRLSARRKAAPQRVS